MKIENIATNVFPVNDRLWQAYGAESVSYTENGHALIQESESTSFWFDHRLMCIAELFKKYPISSILDIGGGNGEISKYLQSINIQPILLEPRREGALNAIENGVKNVINGSLKSAGIKDTAINAVGIFDVLEHIESDQDFLIELNRVLKPGGKVFISVPAYQFLFSTFDQKVGHYRRYTLDKLQKLLAETGFAVDYKSYIFSLLPLPILLIRTLYQKKISQNSHSKMGHISKKGVLGKFIRIALAPELLLLRNNIRIPFGSSCIVVATKH